MNILRMIYICIKQMKKKVRLLAPKHTFDGFSTRILKRCVYGPSVSLEYKIRVRVVFLR